MIVSYARGDAAGLQWPNGHGLLQGGLQYSQSRSMQEGLLVIQEESVARSKQLS